MQLHYYQAYSFVNVREAWHKLAKMPKQEAMEKYVGVVCRVDPGWESTPLDDAQLVCAFITCAYCEREGGGGVCVFVSVCVCVCV